MNEKLFELNYKDDKKSNKKKLKPKDINKMNRKITVSCVSPAVKTLACHASDPGSNPGRAIAAVV